MAKRVRTEEELADALKNDEETIEIEFDLKNRVMKMKATGKVAWGVCFIAIAAIVATTLATIGTGGAAAPAALIAGVSAAPILGLALGVPVVTSLISIAVAAGGVGVLNKLRDYKLVDHGDYITLHKN